MRISYMYSRLIGRSGIVDDFGELQSGRQGICSIHTYFESSNKLGYPSKLIRNFTRSNKDSDYIAVHNF